MRREPLPAALGQRLLGLPRRSLSRSMRALSSSRAWEPSEAAARREKSDAIPTKKLQYGDFLEIHWENGLRTHADPTLASMSSSNNTTTSYMRCGALADDSTLALCVVHDGPATPPGHRPPHGHAHPFESANQCNTVTVPPATSCIRQLPDALGRHHRRRDVEEVARADCAARGWRQAPHIR